VKKAKVLTEDLAVQDLELWAMLSQANYALLRGREKELLQYGISLAQAGVLIVIQTAGHPVTPAEIARWLTRTQNSVAGVLNRMENDGLIMRVKDLEKRNLVRVAITEKGKQLYHDSSNREIIHRRLSCLSKAERRNLRSSLEKLRDTAFKELGVKKPPFPR
jgi:DNA-binding MarR family transcriptional regulator